MPLNYKTETKAAYEKLADFYEKKFQDYHEKNYEKYFKKEIKEFAKKLSAKAKILDIGSAAGDYALLLKKNGFNVLCIDISKKMIQKCEKKGLKARVMDFEQMNFSKNSFDGALSVLSLFHAPKNKLRKILKRIHEILKSNGVLLLKMEQGKGEGFVEKKHYQGTKKYFSLFTDSELRKYFGQLFEIEFFSKTRIGKKVVLSYILRKKK